MDTVLEVQNGQIGGKVAIVGDTFPRQNVVMHLTMMGAALGMRTMVPDAIDDTMARLPRRALASGHVREQGAKEKARRLKQVARQEATK